jgi:hypothetical protein
MPKPPEKISLPRLKWRSEMRNNRRGQVAAWEDGVFRMIEAKKDLWALFFERGDVAEQYGCGPSRTVKAEARKIAAAGLPAPAEWRAMGRKLGSCPVTTRRVTDAGGVRLVWEESIIDGHKVCLATSVAGEWKMRSADDGSFALFFIRPGGSIESLGSGAMRTVHKRALEGEAAQLDEAVAEGPLEAEPADDADRGADVDAVIDVETEVDSASDAVPRADVGADVDVDVDADADDELADDVGAVGSNGSGDASSDVAQSRAADKKMMMDSLKDVLEALEPSG